MAHAIAVDTSRSSIADLLMSMSHAREGRVKWIAFFVALAIHGLALLINFPEIRRAVEQPREQSYLVVKKYVPPPPMVEHRQVARRERLVRRVAIPDPTPDQPEPIREPEPEILPPPLPADVEVLIGVPEPPAPEPRGAPLIAGVAGVTHPVLIEGTRIEPEYPELARVARVEASVVLQAVIRDDGTVGDLVVLRCSRPNMGFEQAAIDAVQQWRYRPGMSGDRPVDVYFTVFVDFKLI